MHSAAQILASERTPLSVRQGRSLSIRAYGQINRRRRGNYHSNGASLTKFVSYTTYWWYDAKPVIRAGVAT